MDHRGEELGRRRVEDLRESHSAGQSYRKSSSNCRLKQTYEEHNDTKKGGGPMTRNKDTKSQQRMGAEQELKVAEKAGEHQVEIQEYRAAESNWKPGRLQRRKPKNEEHEMEVEIEKVVKAQEEAQSAAEVADREEQIAHNTENRTTSRRRRTRRNTSRK